MTDYAYELNGDRVSREGFYAVACDPRRSVAVQACAGAGKTWMLVSRILRALLEGAPPHEILAITFTKKAAGEMRQRLTEWLEGFARATPEQLQQNIAALVEALNKAKPATSKGVYLRKVSVSSTMGPGIRVDVGTFAASAGQ